MKAKQVILGAAVVVAMFVAAAWPVPGTDRSEPAPGLPSAPGAARATVPSGPPASAAPVAATASVPLDCAHGESVAATVNGRPITVARVCERLLFLTGSTSDASRAAEVLDVLVDAELVASALAARGIEVPAARVDAETRAIDPGTGRPTHPQLATVARERAALGVLVEHSAHLEPTADDLSAVTSRGRGATATVDAWIARVPGDASEEDEHAAEAAATSALERLRADRDPSAPGLAHLEAFELEAGQGESELEAAMLGPDGEKWQGPLRTRAGWVVARATGVDRDPMPRDPRIDPRQAAAVLVRKREEDRILGELRAAASVERYVR